MFRTVIASLSFMVVSAAPVLAEDVVPASLDLKAPVALMASAAPTTPFASAIDRSVTLTPPAAAAASRGPVLPSLYASLAALQAFDAYSTSSALKRGAVEANPMMKSIAGNSAALWAVKGGTTAASIYFAERLWKQNRRMHAIALMAATNGLMATVAARNASVLRQLR